VSVAIGCLLMILAAQPSRDEPRDPAQVMLEAEALWQAGDDAGVLETFERAHAADPRPEYLFGQGRALAALGRCAEAIAKFEAFLDTEPAEEPAAAARTEISRCGGDPDAAPREPDQTPTATSPTPEPESPPATMKPAITSPPIDTRTRSLDRWALGLGVSGGLATIAGAVTLGVGIARVKRPQGSTSEDDYVDRIRGGKALFVTGTVIASIGTSLVIAALVKAVVTRRRTASATAGPTRTRPNHRGSRATTRGRAAVGGVRFVLE
jgi:tetratricopeptide (TPR) repeat protein